MVVVEGALLGKLAAERLNVPVVILGRRVPPLNVTASAVKLPGLAPSLSAPLLISNVPAEGSGIDLVDVSSGGLTPEQKITVGPGYQVPFARRIRNDTSLPVAAVGLITDSSQAEQVLVDGAADAVFVGRNLLREPMWPLKAAKELGVEDTLDWPTPYQSARYRGNIP